MANKLFDMANEMLDTVAAARKEQFGKDEILYKALGAVMGKLIDLKQLVRGEEVGR